MVKLIYFFTRYPSMVLCSSVSLSVVYWVLESYIHQKAFSHGSFIENLWPHDANELWMRAVTTVFILIFGYFAYRYQVEISKLQHQLLIDNTAINHMRESVVVTSPKNTIIRVNPAFTQTTGYEAAEVIGKNPSMMQSGRQDADFYKVMWEAIEKHGKWEGELWNRRKDGDIYPEWLSVSRVFNPHRSGEVLCHVAVFRDITMRKEDERRMMHYAYYDALTDLPNRRLLISSAEQLIRLAVRKKQHVAVLFVDVDKFKAVNDTYGHDAGDALLIALGSWIQSCIRDSDVVARLGGDEFVVLLADPGSVAEAELVAHKILKDILSKVIEVNGHEIHPEVSIGGAIYPRDGHDIESLLKAADEQVYIAKVATSAAGKVSFNKSG